MSEQKQISRHEWMGRARDHLAAMLSDGVALLTDWQDMSNEERAARLEKIGEQLSTILTMVRTRFIFNGNGEDKS